MHTHSHSLTHTHTQSSTHTHTGVSSCMHAHSHSLTHTHTHTHTEQFYRTLLSPLLPATTFLAQNGTQRYAMKELSEMALRIPFWNKAIAPALYLNVTSR